MTNLEDILEGHRRLWSPSLELGIPVIDEQHRQLVAKLEELLKTIHQGGRYDKVLGLVAYLQRYTYEHFQTEENLMRRCKYPQVEEHIQKHDTFQGNIFKVKEFIRKHPSSQEALKLIESIMVQWYIEHIGRVDQDYAKFMRENDLLKEIK